MRCEDCRFERVAKNVFPPFEVIFLCGHPEIDVPGGEVACSSVNPVGICPLWEPVCSDSNNSCIHTLITEIKTRDRIIEAQTKWIEELEGSVLKWAKVVKSL